MFRKLILSNTYFDDEKLKPDFLPRIAFFQNSYFFNYMKLKIILKNYYCDASSKIYLGLWIDRKR